MNNEKRRGVSRREFIKTAIVIAAASLSSKFAIDAAISSDGGRGAGGYYEFFFLEDDKERLEYYDMLGFVIEENGRKCVANPLLPDKCMAYTKPYEEDRFELLPPGAREDFYSRCVRCGLCYFACSYMGYYAIRLVDERGGLRKVGTPVVDDVMYRPCTLCMECTRVCPTGALEEVPREEAGMGIALIDPDLCWAWNSGDCKSCAKACPFGSEVFEFTFTEWGLHTRVRPDKCTGCGLCVSACPIEGSAIHVLPRGVYEERTRNYKNTGMSYEEYLKLIQETERKDPFKATWRTAINTDYIQNVRGFIEEKIETKKTSSRILGNTGSDDASF